MKIKKLATVAVAAIIAATPALADGALLHDGAPQAVGFSPEGIANLDAALDKDVSSGNLAGIQTILVRHGQIVDFHTFGRKNVANNIKLARDAIFRIYSMSKPEIGVAMMILYEKGLWKLDDPVTKFIPEFAHLKVLNGKDANGNPVLVDAVRPPNMREIMTHTAGFGYGLAPGNPVDDQFRSDKVLVSNGLADMVTKISKIPLLYQPGTHWSYSVAVDIQGYIIEKLTGQKLGTFLREKIWQPLGMKDTGFQTPEGGASRLSSLYINFGSLIEATPQLSPLVQDFTKPPSMESGGGGLVSTTNDYAIFCQMMLNKGEYKGVRILKPETVALMEQNQLESTVTPVASMGAEPNINGSTVGFGLDFAIALDPAKFNLPIGAGSIWWGGAAGTWFWIDPKNDLFFIGMIQRMGGGMTGTDNLAFSSQRLVYSALTDPAK